MIDIRLLREHPEVMRDNLRKRDSDWPLDRVLAADKEWREVLRKVEDLKAERNRATMEMAKLDAKEREPRRAKLKKLNDEITHAEQKQEALAKEVRDALLVSPNILHERVPKGKDDSENVPLRKEGKLPKFGFTPKDHIGIGLSLGLFDFDKAAEASGARFYYLKNEAVFLELALMRYALDTTTKKGFTPLITPNLLRYWVLEGAGYFPKFREDTYKIDGEDLYLVGTSEQAITAIHANETLREEDLPLRYTAFSPCYRTEVGAHGRDTKGVIRVHQFDKVEQFVFCHPNDAWKEFDRLQRNHEEILEGLGIPYQVVEICTGDIGIVAARKLDTEGWFPAQQKYRELSSCSNCTDYQARRLNVRLAGGGFVHTLNCTALPSPRTLACVLENYQKEDGTVSVPKVLQPYMNGIKEIALKKTKR
ncbi:serine--tRNA ligase [Candidatus Micrarchaeota archaeon]|nr:serine--tRNA ligase [Candidatus Micrarchaeota archaeon]